MNLQDVIWGIALAGMGLVALGFLYVIIQAGKPADDAARAKSARTARQLQGWLFGALVAVFIVGSWATLRRFPIPPQHSPLDVPQVVDIVGHQWLWQVRPATVTAGRAVEFRVTSTDVNHGLAIYAPDGHIIAQTQAMPGYTNKLLHTFAEPGTYTLQCLEFCGLGHVPMHSTFQVVPATEAAIQGS